MQIGDMLLHDGVVTDDQLMAARHHQARFGGRFGSALVQLGFVDLDALARALGRQHSVAPVLRKHLPNIDSTAVKLLGSRAAEHYFAIPLGHSSKTPRRLIVAFRDPTLTAIEEVAFATGQRIEAAVAPEMLVFELLERCYGIRRNVPLRYVHAARAAIWGGGKGPPASLPKAPPVGAAIPLPPAPMMRRAPPPRRPAPPAAPSSPAREPPRLTTIMPPAVPYSVAIHAAEPFPLEPEREPDPTEAAEPVLSDEPEWAELLPEDEVPPSPRRAYSLAPAAPLVPQFTEPMSAEAMSAALRSPSIPPPPLPASFVAEWSAAEADSPPPAPLPPPRLPAAPSAMLPISIAPHPVPSPSGPRGDADMPVRPAIGALDAIARIASAETRDDVGDALVDYLRSTYGCGVVFIVRDDLAVGWKGFADGVSDATLAGLTIPLGGPSVLGIARQIESVFRGTPPAEGAMLDNRLWRVVRSPPPLEVIVAPIVVGMRVVNLVYAHGVEGGLLPSRASADLARVAAAAAESYTRMARNAPPRGAVG